MAFCVLHVLYCYSVLVTSAADSLEREAPGTTCYVSSETTLSLHVVLAVSEEHLYCIQANGTMKVHVNNKDCSATNTLMCEQFIVSTWNVIETESSFMYL